MAAAVFFVGVFSVDGWNRIGYDPLSMFVSELSLGAHGWVQIVNFLVTGALVVAFGRGLAVHFGSGPASRAGPLLVQIIGISLMASGPFTTDPSALFDQVSVHGLVHGVFGAVVFSLAPISCFVFYRRFHRDPIWRALAGWTLAVGVALVVGIVVLKISQLPASGLFDWKGLVQRAVLVTFFAWLFAFAARLWFYAGRRDLP
jgi:Protein of unknown function (DUF998)